MLGREVNLKMNLSAHSSIRRTALTCSGEYAQILAIVRFHANVKRVSSLF